MSLSGARMLLVICLATVLGTLLVAAPPSAAQEEGAGFLAANGRVSYRLYCASCHGESGAGNGAVAKFLKDEPSDLTRIEQRYGEWPEDMLYMTIDGREEVGAHGRREMPVWGEVFQSPMSDSVETEEEGIERADRKIRELVLFLKTIQVED